jgi:hypothetical protein
MLYSVRSERLLMEEIDYSMLFRWFVGMNLDEPHEGERKVSLLIHATCTLVPFATV